MPQKLFLLVVLVIGAYGSEPGPAPPAPPGLDYECDSLCASFNCENPEYLNTQCVVDDIYYDLRFCYRLKTVTTGKMHKVHVHAWVEEGRIVVPSGPQNFEALSVVEDKCLMPSGVEYNVKGNLNTFLTLTEGDPGKFHVNFNLKAYPVNPFNEMVNLDIEKTPASIKIKAAVTMETDEKCLISLITTELQDAACIKLLPQAPPAPGPAPVAAPVAAFTQSGEEDPGVWCGEVTKYPLYCDSCPSADIIFSGFVCFKLTVDSTEKAQKARLHAWTRGCAVVVDGKDTYEVKGVLNAFLMQNAQHEKYHLNLNLLATPTGSTPAVTSQTKGPKPKKIHIKFNIIPQVGWENGCFLEQVEMDVLEAICEVVETITGGKPKAAEATEGTAAIQAMQCEAATSVAPWAWALIGAACATMAIVGLAIGGAIWFVCHQQRQAKELLYEQVDSQYSASNGTLAPTSTKVTPTPNIAFA